MQESTVILRHPHLDVPLRRAIEGTAALDNLIDRGWVPVAVFRPHGTGWEISGLAGNPLSPAELWERLGISDQYGQPRHQAERTESEFRTGGQVPDEALDEAHAYASGQEATR